MSSLFRFSGSFLPGLEHQPRCRGSRLFRLLTHAPLRPPHRRQSCMAETALRLFRWSRTDHDFSSRRELFYLRGLKSSEACRPSCDAAGTCGWVVPAGLFFVSKGRYVFSFFTVRTVLDFHGPSTPIFRLSARNVFAGFPTAEPR